MFQFISMGSWCNTRLDTDCSRNRYIIFLNCLLCPVSLTYSSEIGLVHSTTKWPDTGCVCSVHFTQFFTITILSFQEYLSEYFNCIRYQEIRTDEQILALKAALWAVGHIGSSLWGISLLDEENIVPEMIKLCEESGVFSIRG
jgi:hypothetical protein